MTTTLAEGRDNDVYLGNDGGVVLVSGLEAAAVLCKAAMETQTGECVLDLPRGVPTMETVWTAWKPAQFEAAARALLLTLADVLSIKNFMLAKGRHAAKYVAEIKTLYGDLTVNG